MRTRAPSSLISILVFAVVICHDAAWLITFTSGGPYYAGGTIFWLATRSAFVLGVALFCSPLLFFLICTRSAGCLEAARAIRLPAVLSGTGVAAAGALMAYEAGSLAVLLSGFGLATLGVWGCARASSIGRGAEIGCSPYEVPPRRWSVGLVFMLFMSLVLLAPTRGCTKGRAYISMVKSDLRNLMAAQEQYYSEHGTYSDRLDGYFMPSYRVTVEVILYEGGYTAAAKFPYDEISCFVDARRGESHDQTGVVQCMSKTERGRFSRGSQRDESGPGFLILGMLFAALGTGMARTASIDDGEEGR